MSASSFISLIILAAIWGASFLFMRVAVPYLGPVLLIEFRVALAAIFLFVVALFLKKQLNLRQHWQHYLILGALNSALPFILIAYSAKTLSASLLSILNATAPIWGALISSLWHKTALNLKTVLGLILGISGITILFGFDKVLLQENSALAIAAGIGAAFSYGIGSTYAHSANQIEPYANAHGSMWGASFIILPLLPFFPVVKSVNPEIMLSVLALGVLCTGIAYILYFRLIKDIGAASALTVTYLMPAFGILWGVIFLREVIGWHTILGCLIILIGTALVTNFSYRTLLMK